MEIFGLLITALMGAAIGSLIGAIMLRAAAKWTIKQDITFRNAYVTVFVATLLYFIVDGIVSLSLARPSHPTTSVNVATVILIPIGYLIQSSIVALRLKITFKKACLVSFVMYAICAGLAIVFWAILFLGIRSAL